MRPSRLRGIVLGLALVLAIPMARADKVDDLIGQLKSSSDYKVRLSSALNLGKLNDKRAIPALTDALADKDKTVRGVAAAALAKLVDGTTDATVRDRAIAELERVSLTDPDSFVKSQAGKSFQALKSLKGGSAAAKAVYIGVGPISDNTKAAANLLAPMRSTVETTIKKKAPTFQTQWPSGAAPTAAELKKANASGFWVEGTLTNLGIKKTGNSAEVTCNLSVVVATFPEKSLFGFAKGGATVQTGTSDKAIEEAKLDCVGAVLEDVVARQVVPTIQARL